MIRKLIVSFCLMLFISVSGFAAEPSQVKIMTQNMDDGTDLGFAIAELLGYLPPGVGVDLTYQEVVASDIPGRTALLAAKIAAKKPDLLALQEADLWRTGDTVNSATTVLYDQIQLLLADLAAEGVPYEIVAVDTLGDQALSRASGGALRITDRNALLMRADLNPPALHVSDVHSNTFNAVYSIGPLRAPAGWISAIVHTGNSHFRLLTTHLQTAVPGDSTSVTVQTAQVDQLLYELRNSTVPVVIAGDFNSDAILGTSGSGPDNTASVATIEAAGYADTWTNELGPGPTWPLFLEDNPPPQFFVPFTPFERIDLIFSKGLNVANVEHVDAPGPVPTGYGSDHLGVIATFQF